MMKSNLLAKQWCYGIFLLLSMTVSHAHGQEGLLPDKGLKEVNVKGEGPRPQRGYPKEVAYGRTPCKLMSIHIATIEDPPTALSELPRVTDIDDQWEHAKAGDEIYDVTSWFPLGEMRSKMSGKEKRCVYYNKTNGYIIANADQFLKVSIQNYVLLCIQWSGYKSRLQLVYLEVDDFVTIDFKAVQDAPHRVLMRTVAVSKQNSIFSRSTTDFNFRNARVNLEASLDQMHGNQAFGLNLDFQVDSEVHYKNYIKIVPNKWVVHECGISESGKKRILAIRVNHVNHLGEDLQFPVKYDERMNFDAQLSKDTETDPFNNVFEVKNYYRTYRVPPDMFYMLDHDNSIDGLRLVDQSELVSNHWVNVEAYSFPYKRILVVRGTKSEHEIFAINLDDLYSGRFYSMRCGLLFYEIEFPRDYESREWTVEDVISGKPIKLASVGCALINGVSAEMKSGESKCTILIKNAEIENDILNDKELPRYGDEPEPEVVSPTITIDLQMKSLREKKRYQGQINIGKTKVVCLGRNPENNKLIMMLIDVSEIEPPKK